jgi:hypothetical protein
MATDMLNAEQAMKLKRHYMKHGPAPFASTPASQATLFGHSGGGAGGHTANLKGTRRSDCLLFGNGHRKPSEGKTGLAREGERGRKEKLTGGRRAGSCLPRFV